MPRRIFIKNKLNNVDAVILCGGRGSRLKKISKGLPKPMVKIGGRPFLDILIEHLSKFGIKRFILAAGYRSNVIKDYFTKHRKKGIRILVCPEKEFLGTGGALKNSKRLIRSNVFIVLNGDSIFNFDPTGLLNFHLEKNSLITMVITSLSDAEDAGVVMINREARITGFLEKQVSPGSGYKNCGMYICGKSVFDSLPRKKKFSLEKDFFGKMSKGRLYGYVINEGFMDIGTPARYRKAEKVLTNHRLFKV